MLKNGKETQLEGTTLKIGSETTNLVWIPYGKTKFMHQKLHYLPPKKLWEKSAQI